MRRLESLNEAKFQKITKTQMKNTKGGGRLFGFLSDGDPYSVGNGYTAEHGNTYFFGFKTGSGTQFSED